MFNGSLQILIRKKIQEYLNYHIYFTGLQENINMANNLKKNGRNALKNLNTFYDIDEILKTTPSFPTLFCV